MGKPTAGRRDEHGWRVPRKGTKSAIIYALLRSGKITAAIHDEVGGDKNVNRVLIWKIRNPDLANKRDLAQWHARKKKRKLIAVRCPQMARR